MEVSKYFLKSRHDYLQLKVINIKLNIFINVSLCMFFIKCFFWINELLFANKN